MWYIDRSLLMVNLWNVVFFVILEPSVHTCPPSPSLLFINIYITLWS